MDRADANSYYCTVCATGCKECYNAGLQSCSSCQTVSTVVYFLRLDATECVTTCPDGSFGVSTNNSCVACATGCATCTGLATNCTSCKNANGVTYYKPLNSNTCVTDCPDATFSNGTINQCQPCIYYTYSSKCVQKCPDGTKSVFTPVPVCVVCDGSCT